MRDMSGQDTTDAMSGDVPQAEIDALYPAVAEAIADALGCETDEMRPDASLMDEYDAESIDFLDIVFRLERGFKVKIPRGKIVEDARGDLPESDFEQKGYLTDLGYDTLRAHMSEVPPDRFAKPMKVADIPRLFTVETFCKVVARAQREAQQ
jgi:acyl carrier protein